MATTTPKSQGRRPPDGEGGAVAQRSDPVVFSDPGAVSALMADLYEEFPRPPKGFNRVVEVLTKPLPRRSLAASHLRGWLESSLEIFASFVDDTDALDRIRRETAWIVSDEAPPDPDVWSGECKFVGTRLPRVVCYRQTLASRLPGSAHEIAWQGSMDHFIGHLYPFFSGATDPSEYDENVACRYQHMAARLRARRDPRYRLIAWLMPLTYRLHKDIPLSNYDRGPLSADG
jgi:hypothetical protein